MFEFRKRSTIQRKKIRLRVLVALVFVVSCFGLLIDRLWVLQVERYQGLAERADRNRIALVPIAPRRGDIVDRNGAILATDIRTVSLFAEPHKIVDADEVVDAQAVYQWLASLDNPPQLVRMPDTSHFFHRKLIDLRGAIQHEVRRWLPDGSN